MPFLGNLAAFGDQRVGAAGTSSEWAGVIPGTQTQQVGPVRVIGASRLAVSMLFTVGAFTSVDVEYRVGHAWRLLARIAPVVNTPFYQDWVISCREVRVRATTQAAGATVSHLTLFATGT